MSRRHVLQAIGVGGLWVAGGSLLAACGTEGTRDQQDDTTAEDQSESDPRVIWSNWPQYIDINEDDGSFPTIDAFIEETGIEVEYIEDINDNTEFFGRIRPQLSAGQPIDRDLIVLTDWMAGRLINLGWIQELNKENIPNASNVISALQEASFDPGRVHSLPWQSGLTAIGVNADALADLGISDPTTLSIDQLLTDSRLAGRVTALTEMQDTVGLTLLDMGVSPVDFTDSDFDAAIARIKAANDSGQIRRFTGNDYTQDLVSGNVAAAFAWSGDMIQLQFENEAFQYVTPASGQMIWSDNMMIPNGAEHKANAERLMNYYYDPAVAAQVAAWVNYICPVQGAQEAMADVDEELVDNPLIFPDEAMLAQSFDFKPMDEETQQRYEDAFAAVYA
ncbi:MAG TPA: spermidine/putrescine ABC transporter substrate-binding protein [Jiangellaceae bacterium]|nr:spermidine/putrescine ABC transporter substrate-binding protein [Jiangellaceae bacterium]